MKKYITTLFLGIFAFFNAQNKTSEKQPLYIVDQIIVDRFFITDLDPQKIENIQVYKTSNNELPELNDLAQNGIINIKLKIAQDIPFVRLHEAKSLMKLPLETKIYLNNVLVINESILIAEDLLKRARIITPDKNNKLTVTSLYINTDQSYYQN